MFDYVPEVFRDQYAKTEDEGDRWYTDPDNNKRPPELLPRDEVARAINSEVKAGRGSPHGGVFLDVSTRLSADDIIRKLPSMPHQFKELADVDITAQPMEVGPTCHYVMGGVEVDADTEAAVVPGLFAVGEVSGGMHGSNRLGGNSLSDLLVFGRRAGAGAAAYVQSLGERRPRVTDDAVDAATATALAPFGGGTAAGAATDAADVEAAAENPYSVHADLQQSMNDLVGIIRRESEMTEALERLQVLRRRAERVVVEGGRRYNPGWHLALDLRNMLDVAECVARAALERKESRGGHTREDHPGMDPEWRRVNLVCRKAADGSIELRHQPSLAIDPQLMALFERSELEKYLTAEELAVLDEHPPPDQVASGSAAVDGPEERA
jgi:succinate dehydrogenase / fumarate reductase flavoprotein subunit